MNKVIISGNLVKDVKINKTPNYVSVASFTLAVSKKYTNENGEREADFLNCIAWRHQADNLAKYCKKGDKVGVVGSIHTRSYETQDGDKRFATEITADEIEFIYIKPAEQNNDESLTYNEENCDDDNLPF